ncbi:MAG: RnfABCDGE type electron transport complex subunit D, partial [Planctomycetota bacterium]
WIPGSLGETSVLCCLVGAAILIVSRVGSWRIMLGGCLGSAAVATAFNLLGSASNPMFAIPFYWHWVLGGCAFAMVFMATDPVSAPYTNAGRWVYGAMIGALGLFIRCVNPAYPETWMLAIIFMNILSPLIDHVIVRRNIARRAARHAA